MRERPYICVNYGTCHEAGKRCFHAAGVSPTCPGCGQTMEDVAQGGIRWHVAVAVVAILLIGGITSTLAVRWRMGRSSQNDNHSALATTIAATPSALPVSRFFSNPEVQPLLAKASRGDLAGVRSLLLQHPELGSVRGQHGISPLHAALFSNDTVSFETLLKAGFDRDFQADNGISPLMASAMLPNPRFLVAAMADAQAAPGQSDVKGRDALILAVLNRQSANVRLLLEKGVDPNRKDARGSTPLMVAFQGRRPSPEIVKLLLEAGANPAIADNTGLKARDFAASFNDPGILAMVP